MTAFPFAATEQLTDEDIVRRIVGGEKPLFEILMRRYNQRIYRAVRAILRNDEDVEDAMQQAYVNAYQHLHQFEDRARFSTWLTRIAINEALARVRKHDRKTEDIALMEIQSPLPDPERQAATAEMRVAVEMEIAALPEAYRVVLMLREIEGLSTSETAETLSLTEDVVKTRLHRARTMLRDNLYRRAGVTFDDLFPFGNSRCDRVVAAVMAQI
jgi:RNA polymerase sigma-70 factor, ECF subfamily